MAANPYLQDQANAITQQATQNLQNNILPGVRGNAMAAGGYGSSRQGIAQGLAIGQTNQGITNSLAGLYGNAYEQDQARNRQMQIANMQDATNRYGLTNTYNLGLGNLDLAKTTQAQNYTLGQGQLGVSQQNANTTRDLGFGNLALGNRQADQSYALGQGNLALGNRQADQSYGLGLGNLALGQTQAANSYDLGLRNNALGYTQAQNSYDLGLGGLQNQATANQQNFYTQQRGQDLTQQQQAANMAQQAQQMQLAQAMGLYGLGQTEQNAPLSVLQQYSQLLQPYSGLNSTVTGTTPSTGGGWQGALGGALTAAQLYQLLMGGR